jgi:hypothetical protein
MSKLVDQLENAIKSADWPTVCAVFKKMTGRTVEPPKVGPPPFNWKTAKKADLYKFLQEEMGELDPIKEYSTEDLRAMAQMANAEPDEEPELELPIGSPNNSSTEYTYMPPGKTPLNGDKQKLRPSFREFPSYDDEGKAKIVRDRGGPVMVDAQCKKCRTTQSVNEALVNRGPHNEKIYICPKCSEFAR